MQNRIFNSKSIIENWREKLLALAIGITAALVVLNFLILLGLILNKINPIYEKITGG